MFHFFEAITNTAGDSLIGYFVRVVDRQSQSIKPLFSDENGTPIQSVSGVANMAKTDQYGNVSLFIDPGTYNLLIYAPDATTFIYAVRDLPMLLGATGEPGPAGPPGDGSVSVPVGPRLAGEADDTPALFRACELSVELRLPVQLDPPSVRVYTVGVAGQNADSNYAGNFPSKCHIRGPVGDHARIKLAANKLYILFCNPVGAGTEQAPDIQSKVFVDQTLEWIEFWDDADNDFYEQKAHVMLCGTSGSRITNCKFTGFKGDGLRYDGSDLGNGVAYHRNDTGYAADLLFDGINKNCRQGITFADMDGFVGERLKFRNTTKPGGGGIVPYDPQNAESGLGMPGPIDLEINAPIKYGILRNITLRDIDARDHGGSLLACFFGTDNDPANINVPMGNVLLDGFYCEGGQRGFLSVFGDQASKTSFNVVARNGTVVASKRSFELLRFRGLTIENVKYRRCDYAGYTGLGPDFLADTKFVRCLWEECGLVDGVATQLGGGRGLTFDQCEWRNNNGIGVLLRDVKLSGTTFINSTWSNDPGSTVTMTHAILSLSNEGETETATLNRLLDPRSVELRGCDLGGLATYRVQAVGLPMRQLPDAGAYRRGDRVVFQPLESGAPSTAIAMQDNTAGTRPVFLVEAQQPIATPDPLLNTVVSNYGPATYSTGLAVDNGRITARTNAQFFSYPVMGPSNNSAPFAMTVVARVPFSGSRGTYLGFYKVVNPPSNQSSGPMVAGVRFYGDEGTIRAIQNGGFGTVRDTLTWGRWVRLTAQHVGNYNYQMTIETAASQNGPWTVQGGTVNWSNGATDNARQIGIYGILDNAGESFQVLQTTAG